MAKTKKKKWRKSVGKKKETTGNLPQNVINNISNKKQQNLNMYNHEQVM